ncbi:MAG: hypothetical protein MUE33_00925 [Cytophagaceae bacterium]|nr:hypothetical protein [Cytophagaceae bacterium]
MKSFFLPYLFCLAVIIGPAYTMYVHYDFSHSSDTNSYVVMAQGNYDVNPVHRYRVIVPGIVTLVSLPIESIYAHLWPHRATSDWPIRLSYFLVNVLILSLAGYFCYRLLLTYTQDLMSIVMGLVTVLTGRWVGYISGLPLTDSLYILCIVLLLYSIRTQQMLLYLFVVVLGGLSKESFLLFTPFILWNGPLRFTLRAALIVLSVGVVWFSHTILDFLHPLNTFSSFPKETLTDIAIRHVYKTTDTLLSLLSVRGLGEIFTVLGVFTFVLLYGAFRSDVRLIWKNKIEVGYWVFMICILIHALISGDAARMLYFGMPLYAILIALFIENENVTFMYKK